MSPNTAGAPATALPVRPTLPASAAFLLTPEMFELIYGDECRDAIGAHARLLHPRPQMPDEASEWPAEMAEAEVVFTGWRGPRFDAPLLERLPRLRAVFHGGGTVKPHVTEAFWRRGIAITTAAAANAVPVAEYTVATILLALKRAWPLAREARRTRAFPATFPAVPGARGSTVGLVSLGLIGRLVRERLRPFDVRVLAYDPHLSSVHFRELGVEPVSLSELMARSDVVSMHTPLNAATEGLVTGELLRALKPGATFINTARGALVREPELIEVLRERPDLQAILDVAWPEPPAADSPLYDLPNVFLTPHIAGSLGPECRRLGWTMVDEFIRYIRGEPLRYALTREQANGRA